MHATELLTSFNPTPDILMIGLILGLMAYGLLMGQSKIKTLAMSVYVSIVLTQELARGAVDLANRQTGGKLPETAIKVALFVVPLLILEFGRKQHGRRGHSGATMTAVLSVLTGALIVASIINILSPETQKHLLAQSNIGIVLYKLRLWWIAAVPVAIVGESFIRQREEH